MKSYRLLWIGLCLLLFQVPTALAQGNRYIVSPTGSDTNPGTLSAPFRTIQHGIDRAGPGDTVLVRGGTYQETITLARSGTAAAPITVTAFQNERPVINGRYELPSEIPGGWARCNKAVSPPRCMHYKPLVSIEGDYIIFSGFDVTQSLGRGIRIWRQNGRPQQITVQDNRVYENRNAAILALAADHVHILNNEVWQNANYAIHDRGPRTLNWPHAVNMNDSTDIVVRGNHVYENYGEGIGAGRGSVGVLIEDNVVFDNKIQIYIHRSQEVIVRRNMAYCTNRPPFHRGGDPPPGIVLNNEAAFANDITVKHVSVINNVVAGCRINLGIWGGGGEQKYGVEEVLILHNTLVEAINNPGDTDSAVGINISSGPHRRVLFQNNLVLQSTGLPISITGSADIMFRNNLWSHTPHSRANGPGDRIGDPQLVNAFSPLLADHVRPEWFQLRSDSLAINSGAPIDHGALDFFGNKRDAWPDIGFHEASHHSAGAPPPTPPPSPPRDATNLLPNPGFESPPETDYLSVGNGRFSWTTGHAHTGTYSLSIQGSSGLSRWLSKTRTVKIDPAATGYVLSAWVRGEQVGDQQMRLVINYWDANLNHIKAESRSISPTPNWSQVSLTTGKSIPANAKFVRVEFRLYGSGQLWIDDVELNQQ